MNESTWRNQLSQLQRYKMENVNCLSYWFPKIEAAGLPVPRTSVVTMPSEVAQDLYKVFDGLPVGQVAEEWVANILRPAVSAIGIPCFIRSGQTSNKHNWKNSCFLSNPDKLIDNVLAIAEFSEICDMIGIPWDVWVVRELLPTVPAMIADIYGDMPVCREFRFFVRDGVVQCRHPYWPEDALRDGISEIPEDFQHRYACLCNMPEVDSSRLHDLASQAGRAVGGYWSVDILETKRGWFVTDMAIGDRSWHWPTCKHAGVRS